jgi:WD40 repeat protein
MSRALTCIISLAVLILCALSTSPCQTIQLNPAGNLLYNEGDIYAVAMSRDGRLLAAGGSGDDIILWENDGVNWILKEKFRHNKNDVYSLAFSPNGKLLATGGGTFSLIPITIWLTDGAVKFNSEIDRQGLVGALCLAFAPDGKSLFVGAGNGEIYQVNPATSVMVDLFSGHTDKVRCLAISPNGDLLVSGSDDKSIKFWSLTQNRLLASRVGHSDDVHAVAFSPDGSLVASGGADKKIILWTAADWTARSELSIDAECMALAFSPSGKHLACADIKGHVQIASVEDGKSVYGVQLHTAAVRAICFSLDGKYLISGSEDETLRLWSIVGMGEPLAKIEKIEMGKPVEMAPGSKIVLLEPVASRGMKAVSTRKDLVIRGKVQTDKELLKVLVNGRDAKLHPGGQFSAQLVLKPGDNRVSVKAVDGTLNVMEEDFVISRSEVLAPPDAMQHGGKNYALFIGIDRYDSWPRLANPVTDTRAVADELRRSYGFETEVVEGLTQTGILSLLRKYASRKYSDDDQLLIFFAGHGQFDTVLGDGYLVAKDSKLKDDVKTSYIAHSTLRTILNNVPCKHILFVADACFGGTFDPLIAANARGDDEYSQLTKTEFIARKMKYKTRRFLTSGGKEYVSDGRVGEHSPFTRRFLEALRSYGGKDGILTLGEISGYLEKLRPEPRMGEFGTNEPGSDFIFIAR